MLYFVGRNENSNDKPKRNRKRQSFGSNVLIKTYFAETRGRRNDFYLKDKTSRYGFNERLRDAPRNAYALQYTVAYIYIYIYRIIPRGKTCRDVYAAGVMQINMTKTEIENMITGNAFK